MEIRGENSGTDRMNETDSDMYAETLENYPMKKYLYIKVGGNAERLIYPQDMGCFVKLLTCLYNKGEKITVLGAGSNTIITDQGIDGVVVSTKRLKKVTIKDTLIEAECGAMLSYIMNNSIKIGLTGFEFAAGIPGTVGGSIYMNAGANGGEIKDVVKKVFIWHKGEEKELSREQINFEYRKSNLPLGSVVTKAIFELRRGNRVISEENVRNYLKHRNKTQPVKMANTGSVFKNPDAVSAGALLEKLGFKGRRVGGAKFSEIHANFIVNSGGAKAADVIDLIETAKREALTKSKVVLVPEVEIMGKEEETV